MILLVGGAGFIGSHMAKLLHDVGEPFVVLDNLERGHRRALGDAPFILGDIRDPKTLERAFAEFDIDLVMHFAAYIEVGESVAEPAKFYWNNVYGVLALLEAMRNAGVGKFVFSSTAAVYGEPQYVPIDEDHPLQPANPYGDTKLAVERMLVAFDQAYGLRSVRLRYFNAAGSDPEGVLGEDHRPESHLIPRALLATMGQVPPLKLFGTDYDTPDGTCIRDYVHVADLADAHLAAVRYLRDGGASDVFNLGTGQGFSVREVLETCGEVTGQLVPYEDAPRRPGDPARLVASSEKIRAQLGWQPRRSDLRSIVEHAWRWRQAHPEGYEP